MTGSRIPQPKNAQGAAVGRVLRSLRERAGIAQERLALEVGIHRTYVSQIDRGLANPTLAALAPILARLNVSWAEFGRLLDRELRAHPAAPRRR